METQPLLAHVDEFDDALETERARWMRRRFLWLCGLNAALSVLALAFGERQALATLFGSGEMRFAAAVLTLLDSSFAIALSVAGFAYVRWAAPRRETVLAMAFWLVVVGTAASMLVFRIVAELEFDPADTEELAPARAWAVLAPGTLLLAFTIACLVIPWRVREAMNTAMAMVAVVAAIIAFDMAAGRVGHRALLSVAFSAAAMLPGLGICWWRTSRFKERFRLHFESLAYRRLLGEMTSARRIHEACLPRPRGDAPVCFDYVYEPMRQIGGDMLFVHPASERCPVLSAVLFDVTGHGIAAALTANRMIGELDRLFGERPDAPPGEVLASLNRYAELTLSPHALYATAFCIRVDCERRTLQWANGGHPPAFLLRADGRTERLESSSLILGVSDEEYDSPTQEADFAPGDILIAYTDGAIEANDRAGRQLGIAAFGQAAAALSARHRSPARWPKLLLDHIVRHRGGSPAEDDTLILAVWPTGMSARAISR